VNTVPSSIAVAEDTPTRLTGISVSDIDAGAANIRIAFSVPAGSGTFSAISAGGLLVGGSTTNSLHLTGSAASINSFLSNPAGGVTYTPVASSTTDVVMTVLTLDLGNSGSGGEQTDTDTVLLDLQPVNDAPRAVNDSFTVAENAGAALGSVLANDSDIEDGTPLPGTVTTFTATTGGTPPGVLQTAYYNGHIYYLLSTNGTEWWPAAEARAVALGGHLVTINDAAENQFILDTFRQTAINYANANLLPDRTNISFFTGFNDVTAEGSFVWSSGESVTFTNWFSGEPNGSPASDSDFAGMFVNFGIPGKWHDILNTTGAVDLPFSIVEIPTTGLAAGQNLTLANGAVVSIGADGAATLTQNGAHDGLALGQTAAVTFGYSVVDSGGAIATAVGTITVTGVNDAPVAQTISADANEDGPAVTLRASYTDPDIGDAHTFSFTLPVTTGAETLLPIGPNLVVNGSFELQTGSTASRTYVLASPNLFNGIYWRDTAALNGWQHSTPYPFEFVTNNNDPFFQASDGTVVLDLNYFPGQNSTIYQDFSGLIAGATYRLAFDASQFKGANGQVYTGTVEAWWNGVKVASLTPGVTMVTTVVGVEAAATGTGLDGANRLEFREVGNAGDGVGTMLDNVHLNATMGTVMILPGSGPNLIVNGSFENLATANDGGSTGYVGASNPFFGVNWRDTPTLFGWQRTTPFQFELVNHNSVFSGTTGPVILDTEVSAGGQNSIIYQDIAGLTAGGIYRLMFDTAKFMSFTATLEVWWNGAKVATVTPGGPAFTTTVIDLVASANGTGAGGAQRLEFREVGSGADGVGTGLDNVRLYAVGPNDPTFSFDPNGNFESLAAGQTTTTSFDYTVTDAAGAASTNTATITITGANDAPVANDDALDRWQELSSTGYNYNPENGHWYRVEQGALTGNLTYAQALSAAAGYGGYLATITSASENAFVHHLIQGIQPNVTIGDPFARQGAWLGATDAAVEGTWRWETGPEAGSAFWQAPGTVVTYANWNPGEPNNVNNEDNLFMGNNGRWYDFAGARDVAGYVVEVGGRPGDGAFTNEDTAQTISVATLLANDSDVDNGNTLAITGLGTGNTTAAATASGGIVQLVGGNIVYTPTPDYNGPDSFVYHVMDFVTTGNLIVNPGAETGPSATNFSTTVAPNGWTTTAGLSAVDYAIGGAADLNASDGAAVGGSQSYFAGGPNSAVSTATQTIDVSSYAAVIDGGHVTVNLSGYFGGYHTQNDNAVLTARYLSDTGNELGQTQIGGFLASDRSNESRLIFDSATMTVPVGTHSIELVLTATRIVGAAGEVYNDGYADNLSLTLTVPNGTSDTATVSFNVAPVADEPLLSLSPDLSDLSKLSGGNPLDHDAVIGDFSVQNSSNAFMYSLGGAAASNFVLTSDGMLSVGDTALAEGSYELDVVARAGDTVLETHYTIWMGSTGTDTKSFSASEGAVIAFAVNGQDSITGSSQADYLIGGQQGDMLNAGSGDDIMIGGQGNDQFVFDPNFGHDTIADFEPTDQLVFDASDFATIDAILASAVQVGADTVITLDQNNSVTLTDVDVGTLSANNLAIQQAAVIAA
jgi:VCBS repeat-containing protein